MVNNRWINDDGGGHTRTIFRDVLFLALVGFVAMVILLIPHIHPPAKQSKDDIVPPGNVIVDITWPNELDADVDLWVQAPGDVPVGYSNQGGVIFNLLRDDLGQYGDATDVNHETAFTRGIIAGEYVVNIHLYRNRSPVSPIVVKAVVSVKKTQSGEKGSTNQILEVKPPVKLYKEDEEVTVFRFRLTAEGELVEGSVHALYKQLRVPSSSANPGAGP